MNIYVWLNFVLSDRGAARTVSSQGDGHDRTIARHDASRNNAWWYLAIAGLGLALSGCVHLQRVGEKPICLLDYDTGIKHCVYDDWKACHDDLRRNTICYKR